MRNRGNLRRDPQLRKVIDWPEIARDFCTVSLCTSELLLRGRICRNRATRRHPFDDVPAVHNQGSRHQHIPRAHARQIGMAMAGSVFEGRGVKHHDVRIRLDLQSPLFRKRYIRSRARCWSSPDRDEPAKRSIADRLHSWVRRGDCVVLDAPVPEAAGRADWALRR
jgi:hypothetical protein